MSGSYVVIFKSDSNASDIDALCAQVGVTPKHKYDMGTFKGFAADLTDEQLRKTEEAFTNFISRQVDFSPSNSNSLEKVLASPKVDYFEADGVVSAFAVSHAKKK